MPTTPRGIWYPDSSASTDTWLHWQEQAETADVAIGAAQDAAIEAAQDEIRDSVADPSGLAGVTDLYAGKRVWVASLKAHFVYTGADWILPYQSGPGVINTVAGARRSVIINFPYEYDVPPRVTHDALTGSPELVSMSHEPPTTTSVQVWMHRTTGSGNVSFEWHAIARTA